VFTIGSLFCGLAPSVLFLSVARAGQGIGGAIMFATALALLSGAFSGKERGTAFAFFGATTGVAVAVGPVLGGVLTSGLSWHWIFWVNIPICVLALAVTLNKVEESRNPHAGRPDWIGFVTFSSGLGLLVLGLIRGGVDGWGNGLVVTSFVASVVLLVSFVVSQLKQTSPMFDLGLLRNPTFVGGLIAAMGVSASIFSLLTYLIIYVQNVLGYSAVGSGVRFLFLSGMSFVAAIIAGRLTAHVPTKWLIAPGFFLTAIGLFLMRGIAASTDKSEWTHLIPGLIVAGIGIGMINVPLASTAVGVVSPERSGMASGVNSTFRQVGIATGIAALGSIFSHQVADGIQSALAGTPAAAQATRVAEAVTNGQIGAVLAQAPASVRDTIGSAATGSFVDALNHITTIASVIALVAGICCLFLIRARDFVGHQEPAADGRGRASRGKPRPKHRAEPAHVG
jgi:EmrB/QacA subfamily drug resistance transporter